MILSRLPRDVKTIVMKILHCSQIKDVHTEMKLNYTVVERTPNFQYGIYLNGITLNENNICLLVVESCRQINNRIYTHYRYGYQHEKYSGDRRCWLGEYAIKRFVITNSPGRYANNYKPFKGCNFAEVLLPMNY